MVNRTLTTCFAILLLAGLCYVALGQSQLPRCKYGRTCDFTCPWDTSSYIGCPGGVRFEFEYEICGSFDEYDNIILYCRNGSLYCRSQCRVNCHFKGFDSGGWRGALSWNDCTGVTVVEIYECTGCTGPTPTPTPPPSEGGCPALYCSNTSIDIGGGTSSCIGGADYCTYPFTDGCPGGYVFTSSDPYGAACCPAPPSTPETCISDGGGRISRVSRVPPHTSRVTAFMGFRQAHKPLERREGYKRSPPPLDIQPPKSSPVDRRLFVCARLGVRARREQGAAIAAARGRAGGDR